MTYLPRWTQRTPDRDWHSYPSLLHLFLDSVRRNPERLFLTAKSATGRYDLRQSYGDVAMQVRALASALIGMGVERGDRLAILSRNRPEWVVSDLATLWAGAVDVPLYPSLTAAQIEYILSDSGARIVILADELLLSRLLELSRGALAGLHVICFDTLDLPADTPITFHRFQDLIHAGAESPRDALLQERLGMAQASDVASIVYTSGTTGRPKGAILTHANFLSNALAACHVLDLRSTDEELSFLPLCHVFERIAFYALMAAGAGISYAVSYDTIAENLVEVRPTLVPSVPRVFEKLQRRILHQVDQRPPWARALFRGAVALCEQRVRQEEQGRTLSQPLRVATDLVRRFAFKKVLAVTGGRLRYFISGGAPLSGSTGRFLQALGLRVVEGYGLTETAPLLTANPPERPRFGTVGMPFPGVNVSIAADGEVLAQGPNVMRGYHRLPEETEAAFDADGWLRTGDLGYFDLDGYLVITGRKKELLVLSTGKKVSPQPLELELMASPYIEEAVLVGDNRPYVAALLVPTMPAVREALHDSRAEARDARVLQLLQVEVDRINALLASFEQIKRVGVLPEELSEAAGELTPTQKVKRRVVTSRYSDLIDTLYAPVQPSRDATQVA